MIVFRSDGFESRQGSRRTLGSITPYKCLPYHSEFIFQNAQAFNASMTQQLQWARVAAL
jgi:hypothetical protein